MSKTFKIVGEDMSDGYHTFDELYEHRVHLFLALARESKCPCFFKRDYAEWFCLYLELPSGQISYHIPNKLLPLVTSFAKESPEHKWDGHTPADVLTRLEQWPIFTKDRP